jgi:hypothetical protein
VLPIRGGLSSFYGIVPLIPKESKFTYRGRIENVAAGMTPREAQGTATERLMERIYELHEDL